MQRWMSYLILATVAMLATGCGAIKQKKVNFYPDPVWAGAKTRQATDTNLTPDTIVRGQNDEYGGRLISPLPPGPVDRVDPRYSTVGQQPGNLRVENTSVSPLTPQTVGPGGLPAAGPRQPAEPHLAFPDNTHNNSDDPYHVFPPQKPTVLVDVFVEETTTGRFMMGAGYNSDAGLVGQIVIDEQNFDWRRWPSDWKDWQAGRTFRGAGQHLRIEALPGTEVQRYMFSFQEPYFLEPNVSLGLSAFYYNRGYFDYDERRTGGRIALGYRFHHNLSGLVALRVENIDIDNPRVTTVPELNEVVGANDLFTIRLELAHDTRNNTILPTEGHLIKLSFEYGLGTFSFPKAEIDMRQYYVLHERPDNSGRHVLGLSARLGVAGDDTPLFEHYFAGGFSTIRGFDFRGASPVNGGVVVGGEFMLITCVEYRFPISPDDRFVGSFFIDAGTVEPTSQIVGDNFRVTPGFELRIDLPQLGPIPLALWLGFPIAHADTDNLRSFHFFLGVMR